MVIKLQDTETETFKLHYIHAYKVFGYKFWLVYVYFQYLLKDVLYRNMTS